MGKRKREPLSYIIKKADWIFVINEGRLVEMNPHAELTLVNNVIYNTPLKLQLQEG